MASGRVRLNRHAVSGPSGSSAGPDFFASVSTLNARREERMLGVRVHESAESKFRDVVVAIHGAGLELQFEDLLLRPS